MHVPDWMEMKVVDGLCVVTRASTYEVYVPIPLIVVDRRSVHREILCGCVRSGLLWQRLPGRLTDTMDEISPARPGLSVRSATQALPHRIL